MGEMDYLTVIRSIYLSLVFFFINIYITKRYYYCSYCYYYILLQVLVVFLFVQIVDISGFLGPRLEIESNGMMFDQLPHGNESQNRFK